MGVFSPGIGEGEGQVKFTRAFAHIGSVKLRMELASRIEGERR